MEQGRLGVHQRIARSAEERGYGAHHAACLSGLGQRPSLSDGPVLAGNQQDRYGR